MTLTGQDLQKNKDLIGLDLPADRVDAIQRFRMKRNTCEYEQAYTVSLKEADAIQKVALELMEKVSEYMKIKHSELY